MKLDLERFGLADLLAQAHGCDLSFRHGRLKPIRMTIRQQVAAVGPVTERYLATRDDSSFRPRRNGVSSSGARNATAWRGGSRCQQTCVVPTVAPSHDGRNRIFLLSWTIARGDDWYSEEGSA
jgi:hypothetical protein